MDSDRSSKLQYFTGRIKNLVIIEILNSKTIMIIKEGLCVLFLVKLLTDFCDSIGRARACLKLFLECLFITKEYSDAALLGNKKRPHFN